MTPGGATRQSQELGVLVQAPGVLVRRLTDGIVLGLPDRVATEGAVTLNASATAVWDAFADPATPAAVVRTVADAIGLPADRVRDDVAHTCQELVDLALLVPA